MDPAGAEGENMHNTYNIYRMKTSKRDSLIEKVESVGLRKQKTIVSNNYEMIFFFSDSLEGNQIWWWNTYREFFNDGIEEPKNYFYFALLIATKVDSEVSYLVSLGKSHFYLNRYIERDFGIKVAIRMADEDSMLLKKSRYFNGAKRQEISSYEKFVRDNYEPGESVEHLKIKAIDSEIWGDKSIVFADSIQMDIEKTPVELSSIFNKIEETLSEDLVINLPKLEVISDEELIKQLDEVLKRAILEGNTSLVLNEFEVFGIEFCFRFLNYNYQIYVLNDDRTRSNNKEFENSIEISDVFEYIQELGHVPDLEKIKIRFVIDGKGKFTKGLKELIDFYVKDEGITYFLKDGIWCSFNQVFIEFLRSSLSSIPLFIKEPLIEADYKIWVDEKKSRIERGEEVENKITYREYYFNTKLAAEHDYQLMDRELELIKSIEEKKKNYKLEIADLYKDEEIIAVKISEDEMELIYNIEQSKDAITLLMEGTVPTDKSLKKASLWFVFEDDITRITEFNSIQFLLAIETWQRLVKNYKLIPTIYISKHIK